MSMSKPYPFNSSPSLKTGTKIYGTDSQQLQISLACKNAIDQLSKLKEYQETKKNLLNLKPRISQTCPALFAEEGNMQLTRKKFAESPRTYNNPPNQIKDVQQFHKSPYLIKGNCLSPKTTSILASTKSQSKNKNSQMIFKKNQIIQNKDFGSASKIRINSPLTREKLAENKKNSANSPQPSGRHQAQIQALKKSKYLENRKDSESQSSTVDLKERMSTASSNKSTRQIKISQFQLGRDLGRGKFGNVRIARHRKTGMLFSIKIISKLMVKQDNIIQQLIKQTKIQNFLSHSHIVKLYSVFDDPENVYLLMELCCEGNLYEYMQKQGKIPEEQTRQLMKETCEAIGELHFHKIIHRDIKPENIVLCFGMAKICDFGWSTEIKGTMRQTFCGSPLYISPELLKGQLYDQKVDLWALGILGYEMITGSIPFEITTERDLIKIVSSRIVYPPWMSPVAVSFLKQLLEKNPENRSSIQELLDHPFISQK